MSTDDWREEQSKDQVVSFIINLIKQQQILKYRVKKTDPASLKQLLKQRRRLCLQKSVLYRHVIDNFSGGAVYQLILPEKFYSTAVRGCHDAMGHMGQDRTIALLRDRFYWPFMEQYTKDHLSKCIRCRQYKRRKDVAPMENIVATYPMELVHLDYLGLEPSKGNFENVLVITDHFTRYAQAIVTKTQTAVVTARRLWDDFIVHYGIPAKIITDQGRNFESDMIKDLCLLAGTKKLRITPYHPQTNGQCERFNRTLIGMLGTLDKDHKVDWKSHIAPLVHAYNCTRSHATGFSPYFLMFGRNPRLDIDVQFGLNHEACGGFQKTSKYVQHICDCMRWAYAKVKIHDAKQQKRAKLRYDLKARGQKLEVLR
jgi:transposase InsO family protein